jgi:AcrR family transcriptional regulator
MTKAAAKKPRRPGRPAAGADLRARVLDSAITTFTAQGIAATPLSRIARAAGVTPALLHYYFGDKDKLIEAIIAERVMPVVAEMRAMMASNAGDGVDLSAGFVNTMFALIERHAWFPQLWVREVLCEGGALRELIIKRIAPQIPQQLEAHFRAAQARGELNPDLDSRLLVISLLGLTLFMYASAPIWRRIFRADDISTETLRRHALALLDQGIDGARSKS